MVRNPIRSVLQLRILRKLESESLTTTDLVGLCGEQKASISYDLSVLLSHGLVVVSKGKDMRQRIYRITSKGKKALDSALD